MADPSGEAENLAAWAARRIEERWVEPAAFHKALRAVIDLSAKNEALKAGLRELEVRLMDKYAVLFELSDDAPDGSDERKRLRAKAQGVDLALSFVAETRRLAEGDR